MLIGRNNFNLIYKGNLRIGNNRGQKKRMGMTTALTNDTADPKTKFASWGFNIAVIIAMNRKTARMTTSTGQLVKLKVRNSMIIKILGYGVVIINFKSYHKNAPFMGYL